MSKKVSSVLRKLQSDEGYWDEWIIADFAEELADRMKQEGISRSELAKKIGASAAYVTKILRGDANFTLRSMSKLARAVNSVVRLHLSPVGTSTRWLDVVDSYVQVESGAQVVAMAFGHNRRHVIRVQETSNAAMGSTETLAEVGNVR